MEAEAARREAEMERNQQKSFEVAVQSAASVTKPTLPQVSHKLTNTRIVMGSLNFSL
jgi:hypothetical protein